MEIIKQLESNYGKSSFTNDELLGQIQNLMDSGEYDLGRF